MSSGTRWSCFSIQSGSKLGTHTGFGPGSGPRGSGSGSGTCGSGEPVSGSQPEPLTTPPPALTQAAHFPVSRIPPWFSSRQPLLLPIQGSKGRTSRRRAAGWNHQPTAPDTHPQAAGNLRCRTQRSRTQRSRTQRRRVLRRRVLEPGGGDGPERRAGEAIRGAIGLPHSLTEEELLRESRRGRCSQPAVRAPSATDYSRGAWLRPAASSMTTRRLAAMPAKRCVAPDGQVTSTVSATVSRPRPNVSASSLCEA